MPAYRRELRIRDRHWLDWPLDISSMEYPHTCQNMRLFVGTGW